MPVQAFAQAVFAGKSVRMDGDRTARAMARIDAAFERLEAALSQRPSSDSELQARYQALRSEAGAALADLDQLIGTLES